MNEVVVFWCREQKLQVTRSRAVTEAVKKRLRERYRTLDPMALLAEIRAAQEELGNRIDRRAGGVLREAVAVKAWSCAARSRSLLHCPKVWQ
jgi:hypothetical protein